MRTVAPPYATLADEFHQERIKFSAPSMNIKC
jgi:hypothetical protein